jgi:regulator of protease activity HflC (stomatin/prohibitin superfamily)
MHNLLLIAVTAIPIALICYFTGRLLGYEILGAITGLLSALCVAFYWITRRRRLLATVGLIVLWAAAFAVGGGRGLLFAVLITVVSFFISGAVLHELYGGHWWMAFYHHLRLVSGFLRGLMVVSDGAIVAQSERGLALGPHMLVVGPDNAVVMHRGSQQTRVAGPTVLTTASYEYVKRIYDLRPREKAFTFDKVLTGDLNTTTVVVSASYGINIPVRVRQGQDPWTPHETAIIQRIDSLNTHWETGAAEVIESSVRQAVRTMDLTPLLAGGSYLALARHALLSADRALRPWGVIVHQVVISSIQPEPAVTAATTGAWVAEAEGAAELSRANAWRQALWLLAQGYNAAVGLGMPDEAIHREVLRHTLVQIAKDPATKIVLTPDLSVALTGLARLLGVAFPGPAAGPAQGAAAAGGGGGAPGPGGAPPAPGGAAAPGN